MTFTHALATNNYGPSKFIVDASAANGTHTTIGAALTSASSGDTIFIRPGSYTENISLKAGVNITSYLAEGRNNVTIIGKVSASYSGTVTMSNVRLQTNSDNLISLTGANATVLNLDYCYLNCTNATGISSTGSNAAARVQMTNCTGDIGTTGIALFTASNGTIEIDYCGFGNSGSSTTANTVSSAATFQTVHSVFVNHTFTSSNTSVLGFFFTTCDSSGINTTTVTCGGTGSSNAIHSRFASGTASCISIGTGANFRMQNCSVDSTNTNAITGLGTLTFTPISFVGSSATINTTTVTPQSGFGVTTRNTKLPAFFAYMSTSLTNQTGDGTVVTGSFNTEAYDQGSNFATPFFTAPIAGVYYFFAQTYLGNLGASHTYGEIQIHVGSNGYFGGIANVGAARTVASSANFYMLQASVMLNLNAGDQVYTATMVAGSTKTVTFQSNGAADPRTWFMGYMVG